MLSEQLTLADLRSQFSAIGRLDWIGLRPARRAALRAVTTAELVIDRGLVGDHRKKTGGKRQVTLIQAEHLPVIASLCGHTTINPALLRRNLVISGINLLALRDQRFRVGNVVLQGSGHCHPCSRMEEVLGYGGYNALRGHGGITARIIEGGRIQIGDSVQTGI